MRVEISVIFRKEQLSHRLQQCAEGQALKGGRIDALQFPECPVHALADRGVFGRRRGVAGRTAAGPADIENMNYLHITLKTINILKTKYYKFLQLVQLNLGLYNIFFEIVQYYYLIEMIWKQNVYHSY